MFGKSKQIGILIEMLDEEHRKCQAARKRVKELEKLLDESEASNDRYSLENFGLKRKLERAEGKLKFALAGEEKEKLLAENKKLAEENAGMRRWIEGLLRFNDTLDLVNRRMAKKFAEEKLLPLQTENEAYRAANNKLRETVNFLKAENKKLEERIAELEDEKKV